MFELSVARKYLAPRWRQLSVSIISLISVLVIALVVWLIVVFFSVTNGLEKGWIQKLTTLTAPIRVTPTKAYYDSYYYQADSISESTGYTTKSIQDKLKASVTDPYDPSSDEEPPANWPLPLRNADGSLKDIVKESFAAINGIEGVKASGYEVTMSNLSLRMLRTIDGQPTQAHSTYAATYLGSIDLENSTLDQALKPLSMEDLSNILRMIADDEVKRRAFFDAVDVQEMTDALTIAKATIKGASPFWIHKDSDSRYVLPSENGEGILVPKAFKESGILVGDRGHISYYSPTMSSKQEQRLPVYVAGFYDPGIIPIGGKFILASPHIVSMIRSAHQQDEATYSNGINVRFENLERADAIKEGILSAFKKAGVDRYWTVETYKEYDFTKDLLQQLQSDKTLFTLISTIIIIVACSNIISMLIILVNDKKVEIGILRSMGASCGSIALIFGLCGIVMGLMGSLIGTLTAYITLKNLDSLIYVLSSIQGHNAFNPMFFGDTLPNELSMEALLFVIISTTAISLVAGIVPALKASLMRPSTILRSE